MTRKRGLRVAFDKTVLSKWMGKVSLVALFAWISQLCVIEAVMMAGIWRKDGVANDLAG